MCVLCVQSGSFSDRQPWASGAGAVVLWHDVVHRETVQGGVQRDFNGNADLAHTLGVMLQNRLGQVLFYQVTWHLGYLG